MYEKRINTARIAVAVAMGVCGAGMVVCANLRREGWAVAFFFGVAGCLIVTVGLAVEYLARSWLQHRGRGLAPYQFTLAGMFVATTAAAALLALFRVIGPIVVPLSIVAVVLVACLVEAARRDGKK